MRARYLIITMERWGGAGSQSCEPLVISFRLWGSIVPAVLLLPARSVRCRKKCFALKLNSKLWLGVESLQLERKCKDRGRMKLKHNMSLYLIHMDSLFAFEP